MNKYQLAFITFLQSIKMPKVGGRRKKAKSHKEPDPIDEKLTPKTFVFRKGDCSDSFTDLSHDFRKCFYPNTAMKLQDTNKLSIKSYLKAAKYYQVTHLIAFQQNNNKSFARFIKVGGGEITFRLMNYCRMKEVLQNGGQPFSLSFREPLIVLNNFTENNQVRQIGRSIQQLFPAINLQKIKLKNVKRVMSFTYQPNKKCIYFRHYKIIINEGGVGNTFRQLMKDANHDISEYRNFADYLKSQKAYTEDQTSSKQSQQEVKLIEMGPRMKLKFLKFTQGFGKVQSEEQQQNQEGQQEEEGQEIQEE